MAINHHILSHKKFLRLLFPVLGLLPLSGMTQDAEPRILQIAKTNEQITIDGIDKENSWSKTSVASQFINKWPTDSGLAKLQTEVRLLYDDKFLYVFAIMHVQDNNLVIQSLKRDINPYYSEGFSVVLDPSGQKSSGFTFGECQRSTIRRHRTIQQRVI